MQRTSFRTTLLAIAFLSLGLLVGASVDRAIHPLDKQHFDLIRVAWAVDLNNRLTMLRLLRQHKVPAATVESVELDAVLLLNTMGADQVSPGDQSYSVIERVVKTLRQYQRDFPNSEFDSQKHAFVAKVLDKFPQNQGLR